MTQKKTFEALNSRSSLGAFYANYILYPKLKKYLNGHVLDYGAGVGNFTKFYSNFGKITPADINKRAVNTMSKSGLKPIIIKKNFINVRDNFFDSAILDNVIEHIIKPFPVFKEVARVTKKNASILIGVPGIKGFKMHWDHKTFYDEYKLEKILHKHKMIVSKIFYMPLFKSEFLSKHMKSYCLYAVVKNKK